MRVGIDLVEIKRFSKDIYSQSFLNRVFTKGEIEHIKSVSAFSFQLERLAGKFAAKEAVLKMLGVGIGNGVTLLEIEILPDHWGKPTLAVSGNAQKMMKMLGLNNVDVSISHTSTHATAICVASE